MLYSRERERVVLNMARSIWRMSHASRLQSLYTRRLLHCWKIDVFGFFLFLVVDDETVVDMTCVSLLLRFTLPMIKLSRIACELWQQVKNYLSPLPSQQLLGGGEMQTSQLYVILRGTRPITLDTFQMILE